MTQSSPFGSRPAGHNNPYGGGPPPGNVPPQGWGPPPGYSHPSGHGPPPGYGYPPHDPTKSEKSWIAMLLLAIFLGNIGVHSFYAGRIGLGIARVAISVGGIGAYIAFLVSMISQVPASKPAVYTGEGGARATAEAFQAAQAAQAGAMLGAVIGPLIVFGIVIMANTIWTIVDIILIAMGKYRDGKGLLIKS